ncbi:hypothetical protein [Williamsia sp.]|uniref:Acg family FMN-binding oxidoreductase n=1 Tax=Williamsia sp. TaxID=1872085 RepID=UPI001A1AA8FC|nr:hypothetical protein [Williamsia sp.]MBJ7287931.1 hypothetical protein [Williamsia sp.]
MESDPQGRQLVMSCGAALNHLDVALRGAGILGRIERFPMDGTPAPLAIVTVQRGHRVDSDDEALLAAIAERRSDRRPFKPADLEAFVPLILLGIDALGIAGTVLTDGSRDAVASASLMTAAVHRYDSVNHHEIHWWAGHDRASDGIPRTLLGDAATASAVVGRNFPIGSLKPSGPLADAADWLLLYAAEDSPRSWLHAGEALSSVLLRATASGFATCTVSHVFQDAESRELLRQSLPPTARVDAVPQVLVRIGAAESSPLTTSSPRRTLQDVMDTTSVPQGDRR